MARCCLHSQLGPGTTVEIRLPLAIIDGFSVHVGDSHLVLPLDMLVECIKPPPQSPVAANFFEAAARACFDLPTMRRVVDAEMSALKPGGRLFVGLVESLNGVRCPS